MARDRGYYHSYRGRTPRWKIALAVLLVLVILGAAVAMLLQENVVYDEMGVPRLEVPWKREEAPEEDAPLDLVIQEPEVKALRGITLPEGLLTPERVTAVLETAGETDNAVVVTGKGSQTGAVYFPSETAVRGSGKTGADTPAAWQQLKDSGLALAVQLSCFRDAKAANADPEGMGLKNTGGYLFYDGNNAQWIDPAKPAAREYLCRLAAEAAKLGADELVLTDVSYPTVGKLSKIAYGEVDRAEQLTEFLQELRAALEPYDTVLSLELPAEAVLNGGDENGGWQLAELAPLVDRIWSETTAEEAEKLEKAVSAASRKTQFVPILQAPAAEKIPSAVIR